MPKNTKNFNSELEGFLRGRGFNKIDTLDVDGKSVPSSAEADQFRFHYKNDNVDYGTVTITTHDGTVTVYFNKSVTNSKIDSEWTKFLKQLKSWALRSGQMGFKLTNLDELDNVMKRRKKQKQDEKLLEGYYGNRSTSYSDSTPPSIKMIIKHTRPMSETDQRYRHVDKIFLETERGERLLLNTKKPSIGRVFARHLAEGGEYNDDRWKHINEIAEDITKLGGFVRATRNRQFNESAYVLVKEAHEHYLSLKETIRKLQGSRGYNQYFEGWKPSLMEQDSEIDYTNMFRNNNLDPRIENALPVLKKLNIKVHEITEADEFESWANSIVEDHSPIQHTKIEDLVKILQDEDLVVGPEAMTITGQLEDLIDDESDKEDLFNELQELANIDPDKDPRPVILSWLERNSNDSFYKEILDKVDSAPVNQEEPAKEIPSEKDKLPIEPQANPPAENNNSMPSQFTPTLENKEMFEKKSNKSSPRNFVAKHAQRSGAGAHSKKGFQRHDKHKKKLGEENLEELSTEKLAQYKKAAGQEASAADKKGNIEHANKRFRGIVKATIKQFHNENPKEKENKDNVEESLINRIKKLSGL